MSRFIAIALAACVALTVSFAVIQTGTSKIGVTTANAAAGQKVCKSKMPSGKIKSWRCGADQACCVNHDMGLYVCGFAGLGCL
jgi:hypothetical protein